MSLTPEQYVALSTLVYESTSKNDIKAPIGNIISRVENRNKLEYAALSSLSSYILLDYTSTPSGFQAAAFQSPSGEIVFSFKGTDAGNGSEFSKDIANADEQIFTGSSNSANENGFIGNTWNRLRGAIFVQFIKVSSNKREHSYV